MGSVPADTTPPPPPPRRRRRWALWLLLAVLAIVALVLAGAWWLVGTESGARLAIEQARGLAGEGTRIEGVQGRLLGGLKVDRIEIDRPDMYLRLEGVELDAAPPMSGVAHVRNLNVRSIEVRTASTGEAAKIPTSFKPPYPVRVDNLSVGELRIGELVRGAPRDADSAGDVVVRDIRVRAEGDKDHWTVHEASAQTPYGRARLAGTLETSAPFALKLTGDLAGRYGERDFKVGLIAHGTLKAFEANLDGDLGGTRATGTVAVEPFGTVPVKSLSAQVKGLDLRQFVPAAPVTRLDAEARLAAEGRAFAGPVRIVNGDPGPVDRERLPIASLTGQVVVTPARVDVTDATLALAGGGSATGRGSVEKGRVEAQLELANQDLAAVHTELQPTRLSGPITITSTAEGQRFEGRLTDPRFTIEGKSALAADVLTLEAVRVATRNGSVAGAGKVELKGTRAFRFEGKAQGFDPSAVAKVASGDLNFDFVAGGNLSPALSGEARLDFAPSRFAGLAASGRAHVSGDRRRIARADVDVRLGEARIKALGSFGRPGDAMDVSLDAPNLSQLAKPFGVAASGRLEAQARLTGTFAQPAGRVNLSGANLALPSNVFVREVTLRGEAGTDPASRIEASLQASGVAVGGERPPTPLAETLAATLAGTRAAHRFTLEALMTKDQRLTATLEGGLDPRAKGPAWSGQVQSVALTGPSAFALQAPAPLAFSARRVELGDARLKGEWGEARLAATRWTPQMLELRGSSPGLAIRTTARALRLPPVRRGSDLVVAADWDIRAGETFEGSAVLRRVSGDLRLGDPALRLGLREVTLKLDASRGRARAVLDLDSQAVGRIQGEGTALLVRGRSGWEISEDGPLDARITGDVPNLEPFSGWLGPDARLGGRVRANLAITGTGRQPRFDGDVRAESLRVREPANGFEIDQGQLALRIRDQAVTIEQFVATTPWNPSEGALAKIGSAPRPPSGAGRITAEGGVDLKARTGAIRIRAESVPVTQLATRFVAISGDANLEAKPEGMLVTGNLRADAAWVGALATPLPTVSEDVVVVRAAAPKAAQDEAPRARDKIRIDVRFALGDHVYFQGRGLDTRLAGNLRLAGDTSALRATGAIRTVDGTYDGYGQKLVIERGTLTFAGPLDNPTLSVLALRKGLPVEAGVEVYGTATRPRVRLVSRPEVPEPEKLSWLVLGRGPAEANQADASTLMAAARAMLGTGAPGGDLVKRFGFDEVRIGRPDSASALGALPQSTVAGKTGSASAADVVTVGKRLTRDIHVIYEQGLADAEGALRVSWQITRQFQLLLRAGYQPGLDAVYRWTFY